MAVDKSMFPAPQGELKTLNAPDEVELVIELAPDIEGAMIVTDYEEDDAEEDEFERNLAEDMDEAVLTAMASDLIGEIGSDISARKDWMQMYVDGFDLLGLKIEDITEPWEGACAVRHPLLTETLVRFQSEAMMETFPASGPVKTKIIGKETPEKVKAAERVRDDMNYQLTERMPEYRPEHERLLWGLGLSGNAFKKVYYDVAQRRQAAVYVPAEDLIVPYGASSLETAERVTHVMRKTKNELRRLQVAGFYRDIELADPQNVFDDVEKAIAEKQGFSTGTDDRYKLYEVHVNLDIEGFEDTDEDGEPTGIALPYVVTIEVSSGEVLAIRRNWDIADERKTKRQHFVHYGYIPGFGFYHFGLVHLIGGFAKSGTMILRQLVDAGTLSNLPGGFKTNGLRIKGDDSPISPAEFRDVDVPNGTIRDNIMALPYKEPSQTLFALMQNIVEEGRRFASTGDLNVSDMSAQAPVGTTLAILERTLKVMSAVQARLHYSMKQEFKLLAGIIRDFAEDQYGYEPTEGKAADRESDYGMVEVLPISDPNAATMSQKVVQYQAVMQMAEKNPGIYDQPELHRQMLEVLGIKNIGKLIPTAEDKKPMDPVSENMAFLNMKPVKAFMYQDHEAHIQTHMAAMQDPKMAQLIGQSPMAGQMQAAVQAHIAEHLAYAYRQQIERQLGVPLPDPDETLPADVEVDLSRLVAKAAEQVLQKNKAEAQQAQNEQQMQDPLVQLQMQELEEKRLERERKAKNDDYDFKVAQDRLALERERIASQERTTGANLGAKLVMDNKKLEQAQLKDGVKLGIDLVKARQKPPTQSKE